MKDVMGKKSGSKTIAFGLIFLVGICGFSQAACPVSGAQDRFQSQREQVAGRPSAATEVPGGQTVQVHLYFGAEKGAFLRAEQALLGPVSDPVVFGRRLLKALADGPRKVGRPVLPKGTTIRSFFIRPNGTAYVDLDSAGLEGYPFSALSETMAVYAIVNTLVVNLDTVETVKIMLDGKETATLAGHIDLTKALAADLMWVR